MEKALIVVANVRRIFRRPKEAYEEALAQLNQHLTEGWRVKHTSPMGGGARAFSMSLVILERDEP